MVPQKFPITERVVCSYGKDVDYISCFDAVILKEPRYFTQECL
jgi:hypothetical protein